MALQPLPPELLLYPDQPEFDYSTFLFQGDDDVNFGAPGLGYTLSDASEKATPPNSSYSRTSSNVSTHIIHGSSAQKQRLERRGHTKSRRGCYNCKRRRIKCQETHPACGHCLKGGLKCEYPALPQITYQPHDQVPLFSLQDMRFFQHFLTQCYPNHPLKQEDIWTHEIPSIAHNFEFLMHAILGFSASELLRDDPSVLYAAMDHRVKAIKAIKKSLAESAKVQFSYEEANALVATCYALTFQSVALDDGLVEYMTFIRGIMIVGVQMMYRGIKPIFGNMMGHEQESVLAPWMESVPLIQKERADAAHEAIMALKPLCSEQVELDYQGQLMKIVEKLYVKSWDAYKQYSKQYEWWIVMPQATFQQLINLDNNQVIVLLHAHWIALTMIMAFITRQEQSVCDSKHDRPSQGSPDPGMMRWLKYLNASVDCEHQAYIRWPRWVEEQLDRDITFFGKRV